MPQSLHQGILGTTLDGGAVDEPPSVKPMKALENSFGNPPNSTEQKRKSHPDHPRKFKNFRTNSKDYNYNQNRGKKLNSFLQDRRKQIENIYGQLASSL